MAKHDRRDRLIVFFIVFIALWIILPTVTGAKNCLSIFVVDIEDCTGGELIHMFFMRFIIPFIVASIVAGALFKNKGLAKCR